MGGIDRQILADKTAVLERHVQRVADRLPAEPAALREGTDAADVVVLNLWQATQLVIDIALAFCVHRRLGTPGSYGEAFERLASDGVLDPTLAARLVRAAGFRNVVAHKYARIDMALVHDAATRGPADLRACVKAIADAL